MIIRSNKPEAKKFKRWITHEVLPSIRRTGGYKFPSDGPESAILRRHTGLKVSQCIQLLDLSYRINHLDTGRRERIFADFNGLCAVMGDLPPLEKGRKTPKKMDITYLLNLYLTAMLDDGLERWGFTSGTDSNGNRYFVAGTAALCEALKVLGKQKGLPRFPFSAGQLGILMRRYKDPMGGIGVEQAEGEGGAGVAVSSVNVCRAG